MKTKYQISGMQRAYLVSQAMRFWGENLIGSLLKGRPDGRIGRALKIRRARFKRYRAIVDGADYDRLSPEKLSEIVKVQHDQVDGSAANRAKNWRVTAESIDNPKNHYALIAREAESILNKTPMSPVVHVGARVDVVSEYLAKQFPKLKIVSVDLQANLSKHNATLDSLPNWSFQSGYVIDMLERVEISPKLLLMMYTSCKMTPREFRNFFCLASRHVKACVILGSYKPKPAPPFSSQPDHIADDAIVASAGALFQPDLEQPFYVHNYKRVLEENGFDLLKSDIVQPMTDIKDGCGHLIVGRKR